MKRVALLCLLVSSGAMASPSDLTTAVREAAQACAAVEQYILEDCGFMGGRNPEHSVARKAVGAAYRARMVFMASCVGTEQQCVWHADALVLRGINEGYNPR